jgi:hypothetical protein
LALFGGGRLAETTSLNVILSAILFNISFLSDVVFGARAVLVLGEQLQSDRDRDRLWQPLQSERERVGLVSRRFVVCGQF